jgi:hypothetical protein
MATVSHVTDTVQAEVVNILLFPEDIMSVDPGERVTCSVIDCCIAQYLDIITGLTYMATSGTYSEIQYEYESRYSADHVKTPRSFEEITELDWHNFKCIVLPVCCDDHGSLLVVELKA